jgi:hypothetical protein
VNVIKNGQKESNYVPDSGTPTLAMDECHMEQVKSVFALMHSISCMPIAAEVRISPAGVYHIFTNSLGNKRFVQSGLHMWSKMKKSHACSSFRQLCRNEGKAFVDHISMVDESCMHSADPQLK